MLERPHKIALVLLVLLVPAAAIAGGRQPVAGRRIVADFPPGKEPAYEPGAKVRYDVTVQIRQDKNVIKFRFLDQLHAHVVNDSVFKCYTAFVFSGNLPCRVKKKAVGIFHYIRLVDCGYLFSSVFNGVIKGKLNDPFRSARRYGLYADSRIIRDGFLGQFRG